MSRPLPPLGKRNDKQRLCGRLVSRKEDGAEILCQKSATQHIIWWWRDAAPGENMDDCWDHGFACLEHWREITRLWSYAAAHAINAACGMPGSRCHFEANTCTFDDLPTAKPLRVVAEELVA
jgi:hypothetical protein